MLSNMDANTNHTTLLKNQSAIKHLPQMRSISNFGCKIIFYVLCRFLASARFQLIVQRKHWSRDLFVQVAYSANSSCSSQPWSYKGLSRKFKPIKKHCRIPPICSKQTDFSPSPLPHIYLSHWPPVRGYLLPVHQQPPSQPSFGCHATLGECCVTSKKRLRGRLVHQLI